MDRSNRFLVRLAGGESSFSQAFPTVEKAWFEYEESSISSNRKDVYLISSSGGVMPCSNPECNRGGYELDMILHTMTQNKETERKVDLHCHGDEGTPKGRKRGDPCDRSVSGVVKVKYKP